MASVAERIAQTAEHFADHSSHGYSQVNRGTGGTETIAYADGSKATITASDVDCSEMVRQCVNAALTGSYKSPIASMYTGDEDAKLKAQGFTRMAYSAANVKRGDILFRAGHTGVALGNGMQADAAQDEVGGITGPTRGDQTGREVRRCALYVGYWTYIYRYATECRTDVATLSQGTYRCTVSALNVRTEPTTGAIVAVYRKGETVVLDGWSKTVGSTVWGRYLGASSGKYRYVAVRNGSTTYLERV